MIPDPPKDPTEYELWRLNAFGWDGSVSDLDRLFQSLVDRIKALEKRLGINSEEGGGE